MKVKTALKVISETNLRFTVKLHDEDSLPPIQGYTYDSFDVDYFEPDLEKFRKAIEKRESIADAIVTNIMYNKAAGKMEICCTLGE